MEFIIFVVCFIISSIIVKIATHLFMNIIGLNFFIINIKLRFFFFFFLTLSIMEVVISIV